MLLRKQAHITPYRGMPTESVVSWEGVASVAWEELVVKYFNAGVLTDDVNSAAWTPVVLKISVGWIKNELGFALGKYWDSSLSIISATLDSEVESTPEMFEAIDLFWLEKGLLSITERLSDGQYLVDYQKGVIYGKKKTDGISVVAGYITSWSAAETASYSTKVVRPAAILTTSYDSWNVIGPVDSKNQLIVYFFYTKGDSTSAQLKIEFSDNWTDYVQETFNVVSGWTSTETLWERTFTTSGNYRIPVPIKDKYIKISTKATGTVTSSSVAINAIVGNV